MQALIVDLSREAMHGRKIFHNKCTPDRLSFTNANSITTDNYVILVQRSMVILTKKESNSRYHVDIDKSSCTCKYFHNKGYCKHLLFPSKELIEIVTLSTFGALLNTKVIQSAPKKCVEEQEMQVRHCK